MGQASHRDSLEAVNYRDKIKAAQTEEERKNAAAARGRGFPIGNPVRAEFEHSISAEALAEKAKRRREKKRGVREMEW